MNLLEMVGGMLRGEIKSLVRSAVGDILKSLFLAALFVAAAAFALFAVFEALLLVWPAWAAAAAIAAGLFAVGLTIFVAGLIRNRDGARTAVRSAGLSAEGLDVLLETLLGEASDLTGAARRAALEQYRNDPAGSLMAAAAVGTIVGLLDKPGRR